MKLHDLFQNADVSTPEKKFVLQDFLKEKYEPSMVFNWLLMNNFSVNSLHQNNEVIFYQFIDQIAFARSF